MSYGSLENLMSSKTFDCPSVGDGVTEVRWTDRHAHTVTRVSASGKTFYMARDEATLVSSVEDARQEYEYEDDLFAQPVAVRLTKSGWKVANRGGVILGRHEHYDRGF